MPDLRYIYADDLSAVSILITERFPVLPSAVCVAGQPTPFFMAAKDALYVRQLYEALCFSLKPLFSSAAR